MAASAAEPDRPASSETDPAIAPMRKQRMTCVGGGQAGNIFLDRPNNRLTQLTDCGVDAAEQRPVGLRASPHRLVDILAPRDVQLSQHVGEAVERRKDAGQIELPDEAWIAFQPVRPRVLT